MGADQDPYEGVLARAAKVIEDTRQTVVWARDARQRARDAVATSHELGGSLPTADPRSHRVLVVDDDVSVRESTCDVLSYRGYEVESANDGGQALQRLARSPAIDLVVLDLRMP